VMTLEERLNILERRLAALEGHLPDKRELIDAMNRASTDDDRWRVWREFKVRGGRLTT